MKQIHFEILEFCKGGRTSDMISAKFNLKRTQTYYYLRQLLDLGYMKSEGPGGYGLRTRYSTMDIKPKKPEQVFEGDDVVLRFAHDPFNLRGLQHGR